MGLWVLIGVLVAASVVGLVLRLRSGRVRPSRRAGSPSGQSTAELGAQAGLDEQDLRIALGVDRYTEQVLQEEMEALGRGVRGVPAYVVGGRLITGLQQYEDLLEQIQPGAAGAGG